MLAVTALFFGDAMQGEDSTHDDPCRIDFNGDGCWGGPWEQIADSVAVVNGAGSVWFDVPSCPDVGHPREANHPVIGVRS